MDSGEYMTPNQRMRRAAEILWDGIARWQLAALTGNASIEHAVTSEWSPGDPVATEDVLSFAKEVGSVSPKDVARHFSISRSSAFRHLGSLTARGCLSRHGATNALRYRVTLEQSLNVPIGFGEQEHEK